jgi:hypothetical protein
MSKRRLPFAFADFAAWFEAWIGGRWFTCTPY